MQDTFGSAVVYRHDVHEYPAHDASARMNQEIFSRSVVSGPNSMRGSIPAGNNSGLDADEVREELTPAEIDSVKARRSLLFDNHISCVHTAREREKNGKGKEERKNDCQEYYCELRG